MQTFWPLLETRWHHYSLSDSDHDGDEDDGEEGRNGGVSFDGLEEVDEKMRTERENAMARDATNHLTCTICQQKATHHRTMVHEVCFRLGITHGRKQLLTLQERLWGDYGVVVEGPHSGELYTIADVCFTCMNRIRTEFKEGVEAFIRRVTGVVDDDEHKQQPIDALPPPPPPPVPLPPAIEVDLASILHHTDLFLHAEQVREKRRRHRSNRRRGKTRGVTASTFCSTRSIRNAYRIQRRNLRSR